jgi:hypothetical protein
MVESLELDVTSRPGIVKERATRLVNELTTRPGGAAHGLAVRALLAMAHSANLLHDDDGVEKALAMAEAEAKASHQPEYLKLVKKSRKKFMELDHAG